MKRLFIIFILFLLTSCSVKTGEGKIRELAFAGQFYTDDFSRLDFKIKSYLEKVEIKETIDKNSIRAIMVPHAGLEYSGEVSAQAYKYLEGRNINTVVLISNSHTSFFQGIAIDNKEVWQAPFGDILVDKDLANSLVNGYEEIKYNTEAHAKDHTLEVQLPFLQKTLEPGFKILPIVFGGMGASDYKILVEALEKKLGKNDLMVISTDMSHYPKYEDAWTIDNKTLNIIKQADIAELNSHVIEAKKITNEETALCGIDAVRTILSIYNDLGWDEVEILKYANSGDVEAGDKNRVVGYGAVLFLQNDLFKNMKINNFSDQQRKQLLDIAEKTVRTVVRENRVPSFEINDEALLKKQGAFVTLKKQGELRGCIGQILPSDDPLWEVVRDMAVSASTQDPRFSPVAKEELDDIQYEISVLSEPKVIDNWRDIEPGRHGVIVEKGNKSGVFLPQVADETGWDTEKFLEELCSQKAELPRDCYKKDPDVVISVFEAEVF